MRLHDTGGLQGTFLQCSCEYQSCLRSGKHNVCYSREEVRLKCFKEQLWWCLDFLATQLSTFTIYDSSVGTAVV